MNKASKGDYGVRGEGEGEGEGERERELEIETVKNNLFLAEGKSKEFNFVSIRK